MIGFTAIIFRYMLIIRLFTLNESVYFCIINSYYSQDQIKKQWKSKFAINLLYKLDEVVWRKYEKFIKLH